MLNTQVQGPKGVSSRSRARSEENYNIGLDLDLESRPRSVDGSGSSSRSSALFLKYRYSGIVFLIQQIDLLQTAEKLLFIYLSINFQGIDFLF